jgi:threonine dehydratase
MAQQCGRSDDGHHRYGADSLDGNDPEEKTLSITPGQQPSTSDGHLFTRQDLDAAAELIYRYMVPTPALRWPLLSEYLGIDVVVKHENCTPTGAFKVRGGLVFLDRLRSRAPQPAGLISASVGNHGMSLAYAGRLAGQTVVIVVPEGTDSERIASLRAAEAEVVVAGVDYEAARHHAETIALERDLEQVPPFHSDLVVGVATYAKELFDTAGPLDAVYVPVGMGSGIVGLITARDLLGLDTKIIGACASGAPAQQLSFEAGRVITTESVDTFAAGVASRRPDEQAASIIRSGAEDIVAVSDTATAEAVRLMWRTTHHLAEPAGAIATAALQQDKLRWKGQRVGVILSGSSLDTDMAQRILSGL